MSKPTPKRSVEEKEAEFVAVIEQIIGANLLPWQRKLAVKLRREATQGKVLNLDEYRASVSRYRG